MNTDNFSVKIDVDADPNLQGLSAALKAQQEIVIDLTKAQKLYNDAGQHTSTIIEGLTEDFRKFRAIVEAGGTLKSLKFVDTGELQKQIDQASRLMRQLREREEREATRSAEKKAQEGIYWANYEAEQTRKIHNRLADYREKMAKDRAALEERTANQILAANLKASSIKGAGGLDGLNNAQYNRAMSALNSSVSGVRSGALDPQRYYAIFQAILNNQPFTALTKEEERAEVALRRFFLALQTTEVQSGKTGRSLILNFTDIARLLQVQIYHKIFQEIIGGLVEGSKAALEFEVRVARIQTISQESTKTTAEWNKELADLSKNFNIPLLDVTQAAYDLLSNQISKGADSSKVLSEAFKFANITGATAKESIDVLSFAINAFKLSSADADRIMAEMFKTIDLGNVTAQQLAANIGNVYPFAAQLKISMEEVNAAIQVMTIQGIQADTSMTLLKNLFKEFVKPTKEMKALFDEWGVSSGTAAFQTFGLYGILQRLNKELQTGGIERLGQLADDLRPLSAILATTGSENLANFAKGLDATGSALARYNNAYKIISETPAFQLTKDINALKTELVGVGDSFVQIISLMNKKSLQPGDTWLGFVNNLIRETKQQAYGLYVVFELLGQELQRSSANNREEIKGLRPKSKSSTKPTNPFDDDVSLNPFTNLKNLAKAYDELRAAQEATYKTQVNINAQMKALNDPEVKRRQKELDDIGKKKSALADAHAAELDQIKAAFFAKTKDSEFSEKAVEKYEKNIEKLIEKSIEYTRTLNTSFAAKQFEDSLKGIDLIKDAMLTLDRVQVLGQEGLEFFNNDNIEQARNKFEEIEKIVEKINDKLQKSIDKSLENIKKNTQTQDQREFERTLRGQSVSASSSLIENRVNALTQRAFGTNDIDEARRLLDEAEKLAEQLNKMDERKIEKDRGKLRPGQKLRGDDFIDAISAAKNRLEQQNIERSKNAMIDELAIHEQRLALEEEYRIQKDKEFDDAEKIYNLYAETNKIFEQRLKIINDMEAAIRAMNRAIANPGPGSVTRDGAPVPVGLPGLGFATGGLIAGPMGRDNLLIRAHANEFIMNDVATKMWYPQLVAMNAGMKPRGFANGGPVTNVGDINVTMQGQSSTEQNVREMCYRIRREVQRGTAKLT